MRCAIVVGATRKACAIASVVSPQISRSVSATRASGGERGVAAREDEAQQVVLDGVGRRYLGGGECRLRQRPDVRRRHLETSAATQPIDRLEASRRDQPRTGVVGHAIVPPALEGDREGLVHRLLGEIEVAEQTDQCREDAARLVAVQRIDRGAQLPLAASVARHPSRVAIHHVVPPASFTPPRRSSSSLRTGSWTDAAPAATAAACAASTSAT